MNESLADPIGAAWLAKTYGVTPMVQLPVLSQIGSRRATQVEHGVRLETYPEVMRPEGTAAAHLQFHLRHELPHLEFLARLFALCGPSFVQDWVMAEPTGQYARRAAFLYEWLMGEEALQVPQRLSGNYVDAINSEQMVTASPEQVRKVQRWRVNDNLPGTRYFCPTLVKTEDFAKAAELDVRQLLGELKAEFGEALSIRAAAWMTLKESKASFAIEREADNASRVQRFADAMARRTGHGELPLTDDKLAELQRDILGEKVTLTHFGIRQSPVFVGQTIRFQEVVHYVAPVSSDVPMMLEGLRTFLERTQGQSSVMRSAVAAFGFVYIHPLADGNGRVHRFLINDILRRDGVIPEPIILPISAIIVDEVDERHRYDLVLERVSTPLMQGVRQYVSFAPSHNVYPDGVASNFVFSGGELAQPLWRYPDLSQHVIFMSNIISRTLTEQIPKEAQYLRTHGNARQALKEIVEMPDHQADRIIRSIQQNQRKLSNVLAKEIPILRDPGIWTAIVEAVCREFNI